MPCPFVLEFTACLECGVVDTVLPYVGTSTLSPASLLYFLQPHWLFGRFWNNRNFSYLRAFTFTFFSAWNFLPLCIFLSKYFSSFKSFAQGLPSQRNLLWPPYLTLQLALQPSTPGLSRPVLPPPPPHSSSLHVLTYFRILFIYVFVTFLFRIINSLGQRFLSLLFTDLCQVPRKCLEDAAVQWIEFAAWG